MTDRPIAIGDYIAGQVCHACLNPGRFYDERNHVWWCRDCIVLRGDEALRTEDARSYDQFMRQLRRPS